MTERIIIKSETDRAEALSCILGLDLTKPWDVVIKQYRRKRSLSQNAYLHLILNLIATETGNSIDDVKEAYREMFLGKVSIKMGDEERMVGRSTTTLDEQEMMIFIDQIRGHAGAELGIRLPLREEAHLVAA